jgi:hypothetical protein
LSAFALLDRARGSIVQIVARTPIGGAITKRRSRITVRVLAAIVVAFVLASVAPAATLALSPLVLGVPHVASSIRYLVLRQKLPRRWLAILGAGMVTIAGLRIAEQYVGPTAPFARLEVATASLLALAAVAPSPSRTARLVAYVAIPVVGGVFLAHPIAARLAFVHLHNLGAVLVWAFLWRGQRALPLLGALAVALGAISSGVFAPVWPSSLGVDLETVGAWLAPGVGARTASRLVLAHVFTDSVHYAFWLGIIPEETLRHEGTLTFRMSWRALQKDFGAAGMLIVLACMGALAAFSVFGAGRARDAYFAIAGFHGYVEGTMLLYLVARRTRRDG